MTSTVPYASSPSERAGALKTVLADIVGDGHACDDVQSRTLFSQDIWAASEQTVALVVAPGSVDELARVVASVSRAGLPLAPRGAGMSYTSGYVPTLEGTVALDMSRMNRVINISAEDMTVTVEAGCTWSKLLATLTPLGLRTPFWGPMSGLTSTIGGGLSQLNAMLGSGHHGTSSESVVALTVVLADGRTVRTGARGIGGNEPFYRHYGPDLAGLFCGDCGALGVKAEIVLRLIRNPLHEGYASFSFPNGATLLRAMAEMARSGVASEMCAFDPGLTRVRMERASLGSDLKTLAAVANKQSSLVKGLVEAGRVALAGRNFVVNGDYPLHVIAEGRSAAGVDADIATARRIAADYDGRPIENTVAKVIRAQPFPPLNSVLGPAGQRWAPVHGISSLSNAVAVFEAVENVFAKRAEELAESGVSIGYLFTSLATNALIIEPVFYWPDARGLVHEAAMQPEHIARLPPLPSNPAAKALVTSVRADVIAVYEHFGCGHFQIGRTYPYRASRDAASWQLLEAIKHQVDPYGTLNPGVLGFDPPAEPLH